MNAPTDDLRAQQIALAQAIVNDAPDTTGLLHTRADGSPALIAVYAYAHHARLTAALRDNFSMLARTLGDADFDALALAYLAAHPPQQPSVRWFGDSLPNFMATADEDLVPHPAFVDIARMDWALRGAFDAADAPTLDAGAMRSLPAGDWPTAVFRLHPSVALVPLDWAVEPAWAALTALDQVNDTPALPEPQHHAHTLLVWRRGLGTQWRSLDNTEALALRIVQRGHNFSDLCAVLAQTAQADPENASDPNDAALTAATLLQHWLADGLMTGCASGEQALPQETLHDAPR